MAAMTDAPSVWIDGFSISPSFSLRSRIAVDGMRITWGRSSHLDDAYPAQLAMEVLDTDGELATSAALVGRRIRVSRGDGRVIFRGVLDDFRVSSVTFHDPEMNGPRRAWRVFLSAGDTLAELSTLKPRGIGDNLVFGVGTGYWPMEKPAERIAQLRAALPSLAGIDWTDPYPLEPPHAEYVRLRGMAEQMTAFELIESVYNTHPLGYPNYNPATNRVTIGKPATSSGVDLMWQSEMLRIGFSSTGIMIPARLVGCGRDAAARTTIGDQIDVVRVTSPQAQVPSAAVKGINWGEEVTEIATAHASLSSTSREYSIANDFLHSMTVAEEPTTTTRFVSPFAYSTVTDEFGWREDVGRNHDGIDFGNAPALAGAPIPAAGDGIVSVSEYHSGWGWHVRIDHGTISGTRIITLYAHMREAGLAVGTQVKLGDTLGYIGNTGNSFGAHLHFETWIDGTPINPRNFIELYGSTEEEAPPETTPGGIWQGKQATDIAAMLDQLNGKVSLPPVRFDWRRIEYPAAVTDLLLDTFAKNMPLYFPGSKFAPIYDAATIHQVIGGTLVYEDGWTLDATIVPAIRTGNVGVTWDQLVTIDEPTWDDFDPDLIFADLGNVTKGVTA